jgi:uncharacterized protein
MRNHPRSSGGTRLGWLGLIASLGLRRPKLALALALAVIVGCGAIAWDLPVSTSRYALVSADNPFQARLLGFFEKFGYPDALVLVLSGGDAETRRKAVDLLTQRYAEEPELSGRVLGRVDVDNVAELLFLFQPEALAEMRKRSDLEPAELIEGGIPAWLKVVEDQLDRGSKGETDDDEEAAPPTDAEIEKGFRNLEKLIRAFDTQLRGGDAMKELPELDGIDLPQDETVDDEGYLVSSDGKYHFVALFPKLPGAEGYQVKPMVDQVRRIRDELDLGAVEARLTGMPALVADELVVVERGIMQTSGATTVGILLLLLLAFRSFRYTFLALIPLGVGVVLTLAGVRLVFGGLNLVTSSFIPVLLALGIDFGVYVLSRYGEGVREGEKTLTAIRGALVRAGPGMLMGAVTTMMAFLMVTTTEFTAYSELGVITAGGLALMLVVTFMLLPALILMAGRGKKIRSPELAGMGHVAPIIRMGRWVIPAVAIVAAALGSLTFSKIGFNARYFDFLPEETESAWALAQIERDKQLSPVQASSPTTGVEEARKLAERLRALPSVGAVQTATDVLPELTPQRLEALRQGFSGLSRDPDFDKLRNRERSTKEVVDAVRDLIDLLDEIAFKLRQVERSTLVVDETKAAAKQLKELLEKMPADAPSLAEAERAVADVLERAWSTGKRIAERGHYVPSDLPSVFRARFMSKDGTGLAVFSNPAHDIWNADNARRFSDEVRGVDPEATGLAVTVYEHTRMIKEGFTRASLLAASLVLVVLLVGFRRLHDAVFALLPVAVGFLWMLGFMGVAHIDFDVANVVALPLILGVGVDAGAHMVHRWRESADHHGGVARLDDVIRGTGAAVLMASTTTALGFATLMLGDYGGMKTLGLSMTVGVIGCLIAAVLVLPSVWVLTKKAE